MKRYILIIAAAFVLVAAMSVTAQMMGGRGMMGRGSYGRGPGGGSEWGCPGCGGPGMMDGPWNYIPPGDAEPMSIDDAEKQVEKYLDSWGNPNLKLAEIMEFSNHFYAEVEEEGTGVRAFELLVNKYTGQLFPEPGPNIMWNVKYGHMGGGMMGGPWREGSRKYRRGDPTEPMKVKPDAAIEKARKYLDALYPGLKADKEVDRFYGYYTIHTLKDGKAYGMLSVNGYTGDVWYHTWHGRFVETKGYEEEEHM